MRKIILFIFIIGLLVAGWLAYTLFKPSVHIPYKESSWLYITTGETFLELKHDLNGRRILRGPDFELASKILRFKKPRPGRYELKDGMSLYNFVKMLRNGRQSDVKLVINKERTKEAFAGKFGRGKKYDSVTDSLQMIHFLSNNDSLRKYGADTNTVMALIMPYTYNIKWNTGPENIFRQFYAAFQKFWTPERRTKADSIHLTPLQVSILASIVEEETNRKEDKYNIASTYLNRIRVGMPLQADPTVRYAVKNFALKRITGSHLKIESPYNTYLNRGLPPGPICTPSVSSIDAVLDAPKTDYFYFVASDKFDGSSIFTSNLSDHSKYARLYQQELTRRMDSVKKAKAGNK